MCPFGFISGGVGYTPPQYAARVVCAEGATPPLKEVGGGPVGGGAAAVAPRPPTETPLVPVLANGADEANGLRRCVCALPPTAGLSGACDANGLGIAHEARRALAHGRCPRGPRCGH